MVGDGLLVGTLGTAAIVGVTLLGAWTGSPVLADGEAGLVCAAALVVRLLLVRAGRALVGIVGVLAVSLALHAPQAAAGVVLAEQGRTRPVVVTSVHGGTSPSGGAARYLCSVADPAGVPLAVLIRRGCGQATRPGDTLAVVYDPRGRVPPRGAVAESDAGEALRGLAGWAAALVAASAVAVVRSFRLAGPDGHHGADAPGRP
ncbi:hypothetical protein B1H29_06905 [Streptomyces pactum]|uniref:DUF3592 domain-containing protein n=1 Tax=Streptomyces pactum TaxID=68249 RepID=A0A1S6JJE5_9ACTN|nr:hypothetical protein B1H29_06905 [Streptomyces pactum]